MSLTPELRSYLVNGSGKSPSQVNPLRFGGSATVRATWGRYRDQLLEESPLGRRPFAYWTIELGLNKPAGEAGELTLIQRRALYRNATEKAYVEKRLAEINASMRGRRQSGPQEAPGGAPAEADAPSF